jgi:hypothetical protein
MAYVVVEDPRPRANAEQVVWNLVSLIQSSRRCDQGMGPLRSEQGNEGVTPDTLLAARQSLLDEEDENMNQARRCFALQDRVLRDKTLGFVLDSLAQDLDVPEEFEGDLLELDRRFPV